MIKIKNSDVLLVSLCNILPTNYALGFYDFDTNRLKWLHLTGLGQPIAGATGIVKGDDEIWCGLQLGGRKNALLSIMNNFQELKLYPLERTEDIHGLISTPDGFLATDTGKNRVNKIQIKDDGSIQETEIWMAHESDYDEIHLNSITKVDDGILVSVIGEKDSELWNGAKHGAIINISTNEVIMDGLVHPHSLVNIDGIAYWTESKTSIIYRYSKKLGVEKFAKLHGYTRGIGADENYIYVGVSAARITSRSTGTQNAIVTNEQDRHSWICRLDKTGTFLKENVFTIYGSEIFDIISIGDQPDIELIDGYAGAERFRTLEALYLSD